MQCEEVRNQFADYVIGQVDEPARLPIELHLKTCAECRAETEELKLLWRGLGSIPAEEPGPELRARFQIMLQAYEHGLDHAVRRGWWETLNSRLSGWWPRQPAVQLALSLGLLVLGVIVGPRIHPLSKGSAARPSPEVVELRDELAQMRQMITLSLMQQQSASERLKGVNWSSRLKQPDGEVLTALLDTLMHDSSVNVRLATVDALRQFGDQPAVRQGVVQAITREESPMVQVALIDLAVDLREKESITSLKQMVQDRNFNPAVRYRAEKGLAELE